MEQRKRPPTAKPTKSSLNKKLNKLSDDIKKLSDRRQEVLDELMTKQLLDLEEARAILGVSLVSLRRAIHAGKIKAVKIGRFLRISREEIEKFMPDDNQTIGVLDAAKILNVMPNLLRSLIKSGKVQAFRLAEAGRFRIPRHELDRLLRDGITE